METGDHGQVTRTAADVYEEFFLPALFNEWTGHVADAAGIQPGQRLNRRVLDVGCGTGVLARQVAARLGSSCSVVGIDRNEAMLEVARQKAPDIEWKNGRAEALPFDRDTFDAVVSQFGLMYFEDRTAAIQEMVRVLCPGGMLAVAVWGSLDRTPGYAALAGLLHRLFGAKAAESLVAPFELGDPARLYRLFAEAGLPDAQITTLEGTARFPSIEAWMHTEIRGWTLADQIDDDQFERLLAEAQVSLRQFTTPDGRVEFPSPANIASAVKTL